MRILSGYFDSIPHAELMKSVARRVVDGAMLHLIKMWLEAPVEETDERGNKHRRRAIGTKVGALRKGLRSVPLLSNLYMRRFVLGWKKLGHEKRLKAYIVNYADDLVICCRGQAEEALAAMRSMMSKLKLTVNETKTRVCRAAGREVRLPGVHVRSMLLAEDGAGLSGHHVRRKKRVQRICRGDQRDDRTEQDPAGCRATLVAELNRMLIGWANYFCLGPVSKAYRAVEQHARRRLRQWLCAKHKERAGDQHVSRTSTCIESLGLVRLTARTAQLSVGERVNLSPRAGCGKSACPVR